MTQVETHDGQHRDCPPCYKIKLRTVQFEGPGEYAMEIRRRDREFDRDNAAYRRLKKDGVQPRGVDKSYMAERLADNKAEIELGHSLPDDQKKAYTRALGVI